MTAQNTSTNCIVLLMICFCTSHLERLKRIGEHFDGAVLQWGACISMDLRNGANDLPIRAASRRDFPLG